jgi:solute:Na+ symporter, SSS family
MRELESLDYTVMAIYLAAIFFAGIWFTKKASNSMEDFFLGGRSLPWWLIGVSMAATNFSIDTPVAVTRFLYKEGIGGVWFLWASAISAIFVTLFFARLWNRARVVTDAELIELRYSGKPAMALRVFKGIYFGILFNVFIMGWVFLSLRKVLQGVTSLDVFTVLCVTVILVFVYSVASGFYGVVVTDFIQYFFALTGSIILAFLSLKAVGGMDELLTKLPLSPSAPGGVIDFLPGFSEESSLPLELFLVYIFLQWWAHKYADGGGKHIQRMLSAKDENHSILGSALYTFLTYCFQVWPWILTGLCSMILLTDLKDPEMAYPLMMAKVLPAGLMGFVLVCLIGAFMSTIDTHLNLGASYVVNDLYRRFLAPHKSPQHYVLVSRLVMAALLACAVLVSLNLDSVGKAWKFLLTFASGAGLTWILRWFWWRVNAVSEFTAMILSGLCATSLELLHPEWAYGTKLSITVGISTVGWLVATFLSKEDSMSTLKEFVLRVQPPGFGWKKIYAELPELNPSSLSRGLLHFLLGILVFFSLNFSLGSFLMSRTTQGYALLLLFLISSGILAFSIQKEHSNKP